MRSFKTVLFFFIFLFIVGCGGRVPSTETSQKVIKRHFQKYSKKYPDSVFSKSPIQEVKVSKVEEIQKNVAIAQAAIGLEDGTSFNIQMNLLHKLPRGWRPAGWEMLGSSK